MVGEGSDSCHKGEPRSQTAHFLLADNRGTRGHVDERYSGGRCSGAQTLVLDQLTVLIAAIKGARLPKWAQSQGELS